MSTSMGSRVGGSTWSDLSAPGRWTPVPMPISLRMDASSTSPLIMYPKRELGGCGTRQDLSSPSPATTTPSPDLSARGTMTFPGWPALPPAPRLDLSTPGAEVLPSGGVETLNTGTMGGRHKPATSCEDEDALVPKCNVVCMEGAGPDLSAARLTATFGTLEALDALPWERA